MKEFKIKLSADVGDLTNQFKAGSKELRKFAEGVSQAENKMEALSQTAEYLAQMDAQLAKLAKKYPNVFNQIFGTVDADIKKALAPIMQAPDLLSKSLSKIGEQLEGVLSGKIEPETIKISQLGREVKAITKALGAEVDLKFLDESSKKETKAKKLINILAQLEKQYTSLGQITSNKYINEPKNKKKDNKPKETKSKEVVPQIPDINTSKVTDELKEENNAIKTQIDQLEVQKNRYKEVIAALEGTEIKLKTKKSTDVQQLQELVAQFDEATTAVKRFETAKMTSGDEYKKALGEQYRLATLVENTMDEVADKGSSKGSLYVASEVRANGAYSRAEDVLDSLKTSTAQEIKSVFTNLLSSMENIASVPVESVSEKVESIADSAKVTKTEVDALADSLKNALLAASQLQVDVGKGNAPAKETMNLVGPNGIISSVQGADYQVETQALIGQMLANLKENIIMSLHNHPDGMDAFTPSDIESFAKLYYGQGTKLNGIIADGLVKTIDFTGISQAVAIKISEAYSKNIADLASKSKGMFSFDQGDLVISDKIKALSQTKPNQYKQYMDIITSALDAALNDAFIQNGVESSLKGFTLEQIPELSSYIKTLQSSTEAALTPTEKLVNLFNSITPGSASNIGDFSEILEQFKSGAIDASKALEMMLEKTKAVGQDNNAGLNPDKIQEGTTAIEEQTAAIERNNEANRQAVLEQASKSLTDFQTLTSDIQSSWMTRTMDSEAIGKYTTQIDMAKTQLQEFANQGLITAEQMEQVNSMYEESLKQINLAREANNAEMTALKARPEKEGEPTGSYDSGFDDGYNQGQARAAEEIDELQKTVTSLQKELANAQQISMESTSSGGTIDITAEKQALEDLRAKVVAVQQAVVAKNKAFNDEGTVVGAVVGKEINALNKLKGILDSINQVLTQQIAAYQQMQQWQPANNSNNTPSNNSNNNSSGSKRQDSATTEALKLLREEANLRVRIFGLEQKGANDADLQHLRDKIALYESLRGAIEDAMPDDVYQDYQVSAMSIEDLGDTKLTISQINADIKDRNNLEKDAITLLKEEYSLRNQIAALEKNGASAQETDSLKQRADLYERIRNNIEQAMTSEQLVNYGLQSIRLQGKNDEKLTVNNIKSNIKERVAAEKADYNELLKLQKEYATAQIDLEKASKGQHGDAIFERALQAETAYNNKKKQINLTQEQTNELLQKEFELQQELKEIKAANADKEQKASAKKQAAADAKRIAAATKAQKQAAAEAQRIAITTQNAQLTGYKNDLSKRFNATKLNRDTATNEQKEFIKSYDALIQKIQEYSIARKQMSQAEKAALEAEIEGIKQKLNAYTELDKTKSFVQGFGRTTTKKDSLTAIATSDEFVGSKAVETRLNQMLEAYRQFEAKKQEIASMATPPTDADKNQYYQLADQYTKAAQALETLIAQSRDLERMGTGNKFFVDPDRFQSSAEVLKRAVEQFHGKQAEIGKFNSAMTELSYRVKNSDGTFSTFTAKLDATGTKIVEVASKTNVAKGSFGKFFDSIRTKFMDAMKVFSGYNLFFKIIDEVRKGIASITEIDSALTELKKVTDETDETYAQFLKTMSKTGAEVGATVSNLTNMAANWARLGYSMEEAGNLAKSTAVLLNVSEFTDAEAASEALISTIQAYGYAAEDSMHVVDVLNEIGNNFAISSDGIATALQDSASALMSAGNNLEQSVAMVAAANKVLQDPSQVGGALRTISLRLRGTSVEVLEEMGEETDGVVESVSKLQSKIKGLTGVNILNDAGGYKDTYTIIKEIAEVWDDLPDINKAATLELLAGKNRSNAMAAMLTNFDDLTAAYEDAMNAEGSAMSENEKYLDSIQGRIDQFTNSLQTMWMNTLNSNVVKGIVNIGTALVKVLDTLGLFPSAFGAIGIGVYLKSLSGLKEELSSVNSESENLLHIFKEKATVTQADTAANKENAASEQASANFSKSEAMAEESSAGAKGADTVATTTNTVATRANIAATKALIVVKNIAKGILIGAAISVVTMALGKLISNMTKAGKEAKKTASEISSAYDNAQKSLKSNKSTIDEISKDYEKLSSGVDKFGNNISLTTDEYKKYNEIVNKIADMFPTMVTGYTEEGNAILSIKGNVEELTEAYETMAQAARQAAIAGSGTVFEEFKTNYDNKPFTILGGETGIKQKQALANKIMELINEGNEEVIQQFFNDLSSGNAEINGEKYANVNLNALLKDAGITLDRAAWDGKINIDSLKQNAPKLLSFIKASVTQINTETNKIKSIMRAYLGEDANYSKLSKESRIAIDNIVSELNAEFINGFDSADSLYNWIATNIVQPFSDSNGKVQEAVNSFLKIDTSKISVKDYKDQINAFKQVLDDAGISEEAQDLILSAFDIDEESINKDIEPLITHAKVFLKDEFKDEAEKLTISDLQIIDSSAFSDIEAGTLTLDQLQQKIKETRATMDNSADGKTFSSYTDVLEKFDSAQDIANELIYDNIKLTEEQGKALQELIGSEAEYADAVDTSNGYVVKNARLVKDLIAKKRLEAAQNAKVEKTQARLQYYDLYKQIHKLSQANGELSAKNKEQINILYNEMKTVAQTIQKYATLERQLLGVANAYTEFANAKEIDDANTYDSELSEMVQYLANAFNTGELGTAQAQAAINGLIPQEVIDRAGTLDERMQHIYEYFTGGPLSKYVTVEFDEEGSMTSAEITMENVKQFIEDGITGINGVQVFTGSWDDFDLAPNIKSLSDITEAYNLTADAIFAMLQTAEKNDISWLGGDFTTLMDQLMGDDLEYNLQKNMGVISEFEQKLANGNTTEDDIQKYKDASAALAENTQQARDNAKAYADASTKYNEAKESAEDAQQAIANATEGQDTSALQDQVDSAIQEMQKYAQIMADNETTEFTIQVSMDAVDVDIKKIEEQYSDIKDKVTQGDDGEWTIKPNVEATEELDHYISLLNEKHTLEVMQGEGVLTVLDTLIQINDVLNTITTILGQKYGVDIETGESTNRLQTILDQLSEIKPKQVVVEVLGRISNDLATFLGKIGSNEKPQNKSSKSKPKGMFNGTAHSSGDWGLAHNEHNTLVGELGQETVVDPHTGRYYTVGDNGAELVDLPKDAIIFNHKQTEELFKNGHINSRGKAYVEGNAHVDLVKKAIDGVNTWTKGSVSSDWGSSSAAAARAAKAAEDAAKDAAEIFDWFEVLLEEINEQLDLMSAKLENAVGIEAKGSILGELLGENHYKLTELNEGLKLYTDYAAKMLSKVPDEYKEMAKNGAVAITDFLGEADQKTVDAINNYREWAQKVADLNQQLEETRTTISDLRVQTLEMIRTEYDNEIGLITTVNDHIQSTIDLLEEQGQRSSSNFFTEMIANSEKQLDKLKEQREAMQKELDDAVASGDVKKYSENWYEMLNAIYDVDSAIVDCKTDIEKFNNAILELHWENFEKIIDALDAVSDEAEQIRSIIDDSEITDDVGNWTNNGLTALGMAAQEMEKAKYRADLYGKEIEQLNQDFAAGKYSQDEYNEKLKELKDAQWDSIEAYESAKDTLVDLNKTRVEAVKDGIQKEIDAYEKLIDKRKEDLNAQKDAHDWANTLKDRTDEIDKIQRQIDAMTGDTSAAANAQRKKLQEELAKAQKELDETYYDRDIEMQQKALDDSLESYRQSKEDRIQELEDYLKNEDQVISDSYALILANTDAIASNLQEIAQRYGISISENVTAPWESGTTALGTYGEELDYATSSYVDMLEKVRKELINLQIEADKTAAKLVKDINTSANQSQNANQTSGGRKDIAGFAKGTTGVKKDQFAVIDENGLEELVMHADGGKLSYLTKGTAVIPNDLTNNIMKWGEIDPVAMLDRNKPSIGAPYIIENQMQINMDIAEVVHIEHADRDSIPEIQDAVKKQLDSYMKNLNSGIKKYTR